MSTKHSPINGYSHSGWGCGCHVAPCCIECPLDECIFDRADYVPPRTQRLAERDAAIVAMWENGIQSHSSIAQTFNTSPRTVTYVLTRAAEARRKTA